MHGAGWSNTQTLGKAKTKKKGNENKRQREALVALAEARIHVDKSKAAHKLVHGLDQAD